MPPPALLLSVLSIAFVAGVVQGLAGFGSALVALPLMALVLPIETVVPLMTLMGVIMAAPNLHHLRHAVDLKPVLPLLGGYLIGTPIGLYLLTQMPKRWILGTLGVFLAAYALLSILNRQPHARWLREWRLGLGAASGALGSAFSTNGPPVILHVAAHPEWGHDRQKATLVLFFLLAGLITVSAHGAAGLVTAEVLRWLLWSTPLFLLGTLVGIQIYRRLDGHDYRRLTFGLILVTGLVLVARAPG